MTLQHQNTEAAGELARLRLIEEAARALYRFVFQATQGEAPGLTLEAEDDDLAQELAGHLDELGDALDEGEHNLPPEALH